MDFITTGTPLSFCQQTSASTTSVNQEVCHRYPGIPVNKIRMPVKPERLCYGDAIGIVAPASAPPDPKTIDRSVEALEQLGFRPKLAAHVRRRWGFLAGNDRQRAQDIMSTVLDRKVKAIFCVRGGYGTARL